MHGAPTYASELKNELSFEDVCKVIDDYKGMVDECSGEGYINFSGGDPLLRKELFKILEYVKKKTNLIVGIIGNPYHITKETAERLEQCGVKRYQVSIDGKEELHDYFRKKGSFQETLRAIRVIKKYTNMRVIVMCTVSKRNMDQLMDVVETCVKENVDRFDFSRLVPMGNATNSQEDMISPEDYHAFLLKLHKYYEEQKKKGIKLSLGEKDYLWLALKEELGLLPKLPDSNIDKIFGGCSVGVCGMAVLSDGTVYPCRRLPIKIGQVPKDKLINIFFKSPILKKLREYHNFKKCSKCTLLRFCRGCPAVAYGLTKDFFAPDPQCWKKIES